MPQKINIEWTEPTTPANRPAALLPTPDASGVYLYPDGSSVRKWFFSERWTAADRTGTAISSHKTPKAAARALLAIGQGPASLNAATYTKSELDKLLAENARLVAENDQLRRDLAEFRAAHRARMER